MKPARIAIVLFLFPLLLNSSVLALSPSDLVINEIMKNPAAVDDAYGEWFEIYNSTNQEIDLRGIEIKDEGSDNFLVASESAVLIPAFGYFVLGCNADSSTNGGLTVNYPYRYYGDFQLANADDEIIILEDGLEIDRVEYVSSFPNTAGASMALLDPSLDNSVAANWVEATTPYGDGDLGTPGEVNFPTSTPTPTPTETSTPTPSPSPTPTPESSPTPTLPLPPIPRFPYQLLQNRLNHLLSRLFSILRPFR